MAFGSGPFGVVAFGIAPSTISSVTPTELTSSRKVDFATGRYVLDDGGGFEGMDDTAQRVTIVVTAAAGKTPDVIDALLQRRTEAALRDALTPLVADGSIIIEAVQVERARAGASTVLVSYFNRRAGTRGTAKARLGS